MTEYPRLTLTLMLHVLREDEGVNNEDKAGCLCSVKFTGLDITGTGIGSSHESSDSSSSPIKAENIKVLLLPNTTIYIITTCHLG